MIESSNIHWDDYLKCLALYVIMHLIRFLGILLFFPILRKMGYGLSFKHVLLLSYAGLRGALSLTLALMVVTGEERGDDMPEQ